MRNGTLDVQKQLDNLQDTIGSMTSLVTTRAGDVKDLVLDRGGDALDVVAKAIKKNPIAAVGIAFGLGYLAMRLTHRRPEA